jgi:hypothetical protein
MHTRRRAPRSFLALIRLAILFVVVAVPTVAKAQVPSMQALMLGGFWSRVDSARVQQTAAGTQISIETGYIAPQLMGLIDGAISGKSFTATMQLATFPTVGSSTLLKADGARVQSVDLPAANALVKGRALLGVKFALAGAPASGPTTTIPPSNPLGVYLQPDHFRIDFDSLVGTTVMSVQKMTVVMPAQRANIPQLVLTYSTTSRSTEAQAFMSGLQQWLTSQTTRNGTLTFLTNDFKSNLLTIHYQGLRVLSNNISGTTATATFAVAGISVSNVLMR